MNESCGCRIALGTFMQADRIVGTVRPIISFCPTHQAAFAACEGVPVEFLEPGIVKKMVESMGELLEILELYFTGDECDHDVGICYCGVHSAIESAREILPRKKEAK